MKNSIYKLKNIENISNNHLPKKTHVITIISFAPFRFHIIYVKYENFETTRGNMKGMILEKGQKVKIEEGYKK